MRPSRSIPEISGEFKPVKFNAEDWARIAKAVGMGLASTNVALPLTDWTRLSTNLFDSNGNFNSTNAVSVSVPSQFVRLQVQ